MTLSPNQSAPGRHCQRSVRIHSLRAIRSLGPGRIFGVRVGAVLHDYGALVFLFVSIFLLK
jgi:hypothetical protein